MKLWILPLLTYSALLYSQPIGIKELQLFSKHHGFVDNKRTMKADRLFSAKKGAPESLYTILEAFGTGPYYHQVALSCNECRQKENSSEQVAGCQNDFKKLYKTLFAKTPSAALLRNLHPPKIDETETLSFEQVPVSIRLSTTALKCDGRGGIQFRIDLFVK